MDLAVNSLTLVTALFITSHIDKKVMKSHWATVAISRLCGSPTWVQLQPGALPGHAPLQLALPAFGEAGLLAVCSETYNWFHAT
jgi:hypothetical protein